MSDQMNRRYRLRRRPEKATVGEEELEFVEEPVPDLREGQALIRTLYLSIDPTNWPWMLDVRSYIAPVAIGAVMRGIGVGEVVESRRQDLQVGDLVFGLPGYQDYAVSDPETDEVPFSVLPSPLPAPLSSFVGVLGHTGWTAFIGVEDIAKPQPGETMVVSAAAGAVGSVAGQLGKARGARVVGIADRPRSAGTPSRTSASMRASTTENPTGPSSSTPRRPTASTSTTSASAARSWITSSAA
jgi:NADPH-dependent curcumin reductase CurA